jgi:DNA-binding transcriptional LysR family regulator
MQGTDFAWDEVRLFLALARGKKLGPAARALGLDSSTVSRRLASLERRSGVRLFERMRDGLVLTAAGGRLVGPAEETEESVMRFFDQVRPVEQAVEGVVRITAPPGVVEFIVLPAARALLERHPQLRLEVDGSQAVANILRREADIAVRLTRPAGEGLVVRRVGKSPSSIFASPALVKALGTISSLDDAPWVTWDAAHAEVPSARWFAARVTVPPIVRASTLLAQVAAVEASVGVALLPLLIAERRRLVRVRARTLPPSFPSDDVYLVCHAALRDAPRIKAVWSFLLEALVRANPEARR